jgi:hypothetical protein
MPGFNKTGPLGEGPGTGGGLGPCGGGQRRQRFGAACGNGRRYAAGRTSQTPAGDERTLLADKAVVLERSLADVRKRLDALNKTE